MALTDWLDRRFGWDRLPGPLGVLTLVGVRNRLRQRNLYDTGLPDGPCRWIQVGVYGGPSIPHREELAEELATDFITIDPAPSVAPPDVVGRPLLAAADLLARAGFIPDWGYRPALGDEPQGVPDATVGNQQPPDGDGVVRLEV